VRSGVDTDSVMRLRLKPVLVSVAAGVAALAIAPAWSASSGPASIDSVHVGAAKRLAPLRISVSGQITCSKGAHFHVYGWALERSTGALAKGKTPPKVKRGSAADRRFKQVTRCSGAAQGWSFTAVSTGKPPHRFGAGQVDACITAYVSEHHRYDDLKQACGTVTLG